MRDIPHRNAINIGEMSISLGSDVGLSRKDNQDQVVILKAQRTEEKSFIIGVLCDGMGGMESGKESANLTISTFIQSCVLNRNLNVEDRLFSGVIDANLLVHNKYDGSGGSTLVAFILDSDGNSKAISVGDSRIYATTDKTLEQLSKDDTIKADHMKNQLLQYIGIGDDIEPHLIELPAFNDITKIILTSDGIHRVNADVFEQVILNECSAYKLTNKLIDLSNWCGGYDNASLIVASNFESLFDSPIVLKEGTLQLWDSHATSFFIGIDNKNEHIESIREKNIKSKLDKEKSNAELICSEEKTKKIKKTNSNKIDKHNRLIFKFDD